MRGKNRIFKLYLDEICASMAVPWLRALMAGLSPWIPLFASWPVQMGFMVNRMAVGQGSFSSSLFIPCQYHSTKTF
jgi:hypothetical protein